MIKPNIYDFGFAVDLAHVVKTHDRKAHQEKEVGRIAKSEHARKMSRVTASVLRRMADEALRGE